MTLKESLIADLKTEIPGTLKVLNNVPDDKTGYRPHEKSMEISRLASHVAEIPGWITMALKTDELDFATGGFKSSSIANNEERIAFFNDNVAKAIEALEQADDQDMDKIWTLRNGEHIIMQLPKRAVIRNVGLSHMIHHRAQLGVYLRLNDIPVPGIYGPSADEIPKR